MLWIIIGAGAPIYARTGKHAYNDDGVNWRPAPAAARNARHSAWAWAAWLLRLVALAALLGSSSLVTGRDDSANPFLFEARTPWTPVLRVAAAAPAGSGGGEADGGGAAAAAAGQVGVGGGSMLFGCPPGIIPAPPPPASSPDDLAAALHVVQGSLAHARAFAAIGAVGAYEGWNSFTYSASSTDDKRGVLRSGHKVRLRVRLRSPWPAC